MELRHLRYFVAVAEELHFGRAARRLHISQPSLSLQIKAFERELGVQLFERTRHEVKLSAAGAATLAEAYRVIEQAERVRATALEGQAGRVARLNVGCVQSALFDVLPPILDRLHAQHPEIRLSLTDFETAAAVPALLRGDLDAALVRLDKVDAPLKLRTLMRDHFIAAVPERHALAKSKRLRLETLAGEPLIIFSRQISPRPYDAIIAACLKAGFNANVQYHSDSIGSQLGLAACGVGIALVPSLTREWRVPRVVYRELNSPIRATDLSLAWNEAARSPAVDIFLRTAQQAYPALLK